MINMFSLQTKRNFLLFTSDKAWKNNEKWQQG